MKFIALLLLLLPILIISVPVMGVGYLSGRASNSRFGSGGYKGAAIPSGINKGGNHHIHLPVDIKSVRKALKTRGYLKPTRFWDEGKGYESVEDKVIKDMINSLAPTYNHKLIFMPKLDLTLVEENGILFVITPSRHVIYL